jgi:hypothetical protein
MKRIGLFVIGLCLTVVMGCGTSAPPAAPPVNSTEPAAHAGHGAGPHDGTVTDWGGGKYHVEFTVDHDKKEATVYILGGDEKTPAPVKATKVLLSINDPKFEVELMPQPLDGETDGACSRFVGTHDNLGIVREFAGTISGEIQGTPYTGDFKEEPHGTGAG